jgi:hypothetical protein
MRLNTYCWASSRTLRYSLPIRKFHQRISREDYPKGYHCFVVGPSWTIQFWVQSFSNSRSFCSFCQLIIGNYSHTWCICLRLHAMDRFKGQNETFPDTNHQHCHGDSGRTMSQFDGS